MESIIDLDRKISRAIEQGRGIRLSDEELDALVSTGAIEQLKAAAIKALAELSARRQQQRAEIRQLQQDGKQAEAARQALERVQEMLPKRRIPRAKLGSR